MKTLALVASVGAVTPIGLSAVHTAFAFRAAAAAMREVPLLDADGEPITMCALPTLDPRGTASARAGAIAVRALDEAAQALGAGGRELRVRLATSFDEHFAAGPNGSGPPAQEVLGALVTRARRFFRDVTVTVSTRGAAGPGLVLDEVCAALAEGSVDAVVLGGVHSDYDPARIAALAASHRLFRNDNLDALIPGEAAAFVVLVQAATAQRLGLSPAMQLNGVATAHGRARPDNDESAFLAVGLTHAMRTVLTPLADDGERVGWVMTDLTFETFRHHELSAATVRLQPHFCEPQHLDNPAQRLGHLGAAAMPLHLALASEAFRRGFAPHRVGLSIAGSDAGERAALVFSGTT